MKIQRTFPLALLLVAGLASPVLPDHQIIPVDIADWGPETDALRLPASLVSSLDVSVCVDHFPAGSAARDEIEQALLLFERDPLDVHITIHEVAHQDKADLYDDPPAYPVQIDYVDNDDPSTPTGQPCHSDPNDVSCSSWSANVCRYLTGAGWNNGQSVAQDAAVIAINADCFTQDTNPSTGSYMNFNGISHEMGHVLGLKHAKNRPFSSDKFQTKMIQSIATLSPYDMAHLREAYLDPTPPTAAELVSTPAIRREQPDGTTDFGKYSFQVFNPTDLYLDGSEFKDCRTAEHPSFTAQFFDNAHAVAEPDVVVEFSYEPSAGGGFTSAYSETVLLSTATFQYNQVEVTSAPLVLTDAALGTPVGPTPLSATLRFEIDPGLLIIEHDETNNSQDLTLSLYELRSYCPERPVAVAALARHVDDRFGKSVAVTGTTLVGGAPQYDVDESGNNALTDAGAVFVSRVNADGTSTRLDSLFPLGRRAGSQFGAAVAAVSNRIAVGAPYREATSTVYGDIPEAGAAYVFGKSGSTWTQELKVTRAYVEPNTDYDHFGTAVALSPDGLWLAVGAPGNDYDENGANFLLNSGTVYLYENSGGTWIYRQKLVGDFGSTRYVGDEFGASLAMTNGILVVGAPNHDWGQLNLMSVQNAGAVFVFQYDGSTWTASHKLVAGIQRDIGDNFGTSVAAYVHADGETSLVIGAPKHDLDANGNFFQQDAGALWVFRSTNGSTSFLTSVKLSAPAGRSRNADDRFGASVAISGHRIVAGAPRQDWGRENLSYVENAGAAFVFEPTSSTGWSFERKLTAWYSNGRNVDDRFGKAVAISDELIAIGVPRQDFDEDGDVLSALSEAGLCHVFFRYP